MGALGLKVKAGLQAKSLDVTREGKTHKQIFWVKADTTPVPRVKNDAGKLVAGKGGAGAQLSPEILSRLKALGITKLPANHIAEVHVNERALADPDRVHKEPLIKWKDDSAQQKVQSGASAENERAAAIAKFARTEAQRPKMIALKQSLEAKAADSPVHAAALLLADTGLRRGGDDNIPGHFGALTMEARHVSFDGDKARIEYVGKEGVTNKAEVTIPALVKALRDATAPPKKPEDRVWPSAINERSVTKLLLPGQKVKDLRTIAATDLAEHTLSSIAPTLTGDSKKDARAVVGLLLSVSSTVAAKLNNKPAQSRASYIAPQVIQAWGAKHGLPKEWLE